MSDSILRLVDDAREAGDLSFSTGARRVVA